jgi:aromatic-L-amino-acid/L-tryptophan decarboxylase
VPLNLVCIRHVDGDDATEALHAAVNADGSRWCTHTRLDDRYVLRVSIGAAPTTAADVDALWDVIAAHA